MGKLGIAALMRRFPRPFPLDNDTAPKNDPGIPEAGHKRAGGRQALLVRAWPGGSCSCGPGAGGTAPLLA